MSDFQSYLNPDVYVSEGQSPIIATPMGVAPPTVALVGETRGYDENTEVFQLFLGTDYRLSRLGIDTTTLVIKDRFTGTVYEEDTDYSVTVGGTGVESTTDITLIDTGSISDGDFLTAEYQFTDADYLTPMRTADFEDIKDKFGTTFDNEGEIQSPLTFGAQLVLINGAPEVVIVPVDPSDDTTENESWDSAFDTLKNIANIDIVIPLTGDTSIHELAFQHIQSMISMNSFRRLFVGYDGTVDTVSVTQIGDRANAYSNPRVSVFAPPRFEIYNPVNNENINVGGQYFAAACAGRMGGQSVQEPLTRKVVSGFRRIIDTYTENEMLTLQRGGVVVGWQKRNGAIIVRHGLTTDMRNDYVREISVHAARDRLQEMLYDGLDRQGLIGSYITESAPLRVKGAVVGILDYASDIDLIFDYTEVKWRIPQSRPTVIQVRCLYKPTMPLNYIDLQFAIDTQSGDIEWQEAAA